LQVLQIINSLTYYGSGTWIDQITYVPGALLMLAGIIDIHHQTIDGSNDANLLEQVGNIGSTVCMTLEQARHKRTPAQQVANNIAASRFS
jgi:hypothetical protein